MPELRELTAEEEAILKAGVEAKEKTLKEALEARKAALEAELKQLGEEIKNYEHKLVDKLHAFEAALHLQKVGTRPEDAEAAEADTPVFTEAPEAPAEPTPKAKKAAPAKADAEV